LIGSPSSPDTNDAQVLVLQQQIAEAEAAQAVEEAKRTAKAAEEAARQSRALEDQVRSQVPCGVP